MSFKRKLSFPAICIFSMCWIKLFVPEAKASVIILPHAIYNARAIAAINPPTPQTEYFDYAPGTYSGFVGNDAFQISMLPKENYVASYNNASIFAPTGGITDASFQFYFAIVAPVPVTTLVPMQIQFQTNVGGSGNYGAFASISWPDESIYTQERAFKDCSGSTAAGGSCGAVGEAGVSSVIGSYSSQKREFYIYANTPYSIQMNTGVGAQPSSGGGSTPIASNGYAIVDPFIQVDPTFANAGEYSLQFSDGVHNGTPIEAPEPASVLLFGSGLLGLGFVRRYKKRAR